MNKFETNQLIRLGAAQERTNELLERLIEVMEAKQTRKPRKVPPASSSEAA